MKDENNITFQLEENETKSLAEETKDSIITEDFNDSKMYNLTWFKKICSEIYLYSIQINEQTKVNHEALDSNIKKAREKFKQVKDTPIFFQKACVIFAVFTLINIILSCYLYLNDITPETLRSLEQRLDDTQSQIDNLKKYILLDTSTGNNQKLCSQFDNLQSDTLYIQNIYKDLKGNKNENEEKNNFVTDQVVEKQQILKEYPAEISLTPLLMAVYIGDINRVTELIKNGVNIETKTKNDESPLHIAAQNGDIPMIKLLLDHGANIECKTKFNLTPLHFAAQIGHESVLTFLLKNNASVNSETKFGWTALHWASNNGHLTAFTELIKFGANIHAQAMDGSTSLHLAAENGHVSILAKLVISGCDIKSQTKAGETALDIAIQRGHYEIIKILQTSEKHIN